MKLLNALPGAVSQGVIWGIMAIGVYITYRILDVADLTVDGSIATGGAVAAMLIISGCNAWVALVAAFVVGMLTGLVTMPSPQTSWVRKAGQALRSAPRT